MRKLVFFVILTLLISSCTDEVKTPIEGLPRSTPEAEGVDSDGIIRFLEAVKSKNLELHSFMILRHGKVVAEGWASPFSDSLNHALYSVTKTFTSTAVGFAIAENRLSVDDKVVKFFPESLPDTIDPYVDSLTVKHLLTMSVGQTSEPPFSLGDTNTVKAFLSAPIIYKPGTKFHYNSYASHILSAIVQKVTGENLQNYLQPRLFEPLGIKNINWMMDASNINIGGWGLEAKTLDLAKLGQLYLQKGKWNGKQLLPEWWVEEATSKKIEQSPNLSAGEKEGDDWAQGYCYQIWRSMHGYRADGAFGQYIIVLPEQDAVIVLTSHVANMQEELTLVWDYLVPAFQDKALPENSGKKKEIEEKMAGFDIPVPGGWTESPMEKVISGKEYEIMPSDFEIKSIKVDFDNDNCTIAIEEGTNNTVWYLGKGFWGTSGCCYWEDDNTLSVKLLQGRMHFVFKFDEDKISFGNKDRVFVNGKMAPK